MRERRRSLREKHESVTSAIDCFGDEPPGRSALCLKKNLEKYKLVRVFSSGRQNAWNVVPKRASDPRPGIARLPAGQAPDCLCLNHQAAGVVGRVCTHSHLPPAKLKRTDDGKEMDCRAVLGRSRCGFHVAAEHSGCLCWTKQPSSAAWRVHHGCR